MWYVFKANNPGQQGLFQSGWFVEGLLGRFHPTEPGDFINRYHPSVSDVIII
jgi:hypothetical protein